MWIKRKQKTSASCFAPVMHKKASRKTSFDCGMAGQGISRKLTAWILMAALCIAPLNAYASNAGIADSKKKIEENQKKMQELKAQQSEVQEKLAQLGKLKSDAAAYIAKLDQELSALDQQINALGEQMTDKQAEIETTKDALAKAKETEESQYASMKLRIKYMYERGDMSWLDMLFESKSFSDMLNRAEYIREVSAYDRKKLNEYVDTREQIAEQEALLESEYEALDTMKQSAQGKQQDVEALQADKQKELQNYNAKISAANEDLSDMQEDIAGIQKAIKAEENNIASIEAEMKRKEEEAKKKAQENGKKYETKSLGNISFRWPLPSSSRITSGFGGRSSPTEGASTNHKGIDISAPSGSSIVAAAGGTVVIATYSASAGNYVMINHGGGVYTVYMHMSSISTSVGQSVSAGQKIGAVGSTGYSTGPHLHFGVRSNGTYVNPQSYVSP